MSAELRTPWDLALSGQMLYVAMAGAHQLCVVDLGHGTIARFAGNGRETLVDGTGPASSFAQPSGLAIDGETMYVADSESSAIRAIDIKSGETKTIVGTGLFDWGDRDGPLGPQMLQHPLAVAWSKGGMWIADSYNNKVKRFSPGLDAISTVVSDAEGLPLAGPAGLAVEADGSLLIADTDRSRLLRLRPGAKEAKRVPVRLPGTLATAAETAPAAATEKRPMLERALPGQQVPDGTTRLELALLAPAGFAFSEAGPWSVDLSGDSALTLKTHSQMGELKVGDRVDFPIELALSGPGTLAGPRPRERLRRDQPRGLLSAARELHGRSIRRREAGRGAGAATQRTRRRYSQATLNATSAVSSAHQAAFQPSERGRSPSAMIQTWLVPAFSPGGDSSSCTRK